MKKVVFSGDIINDVEIIVIDEKREHVLKNLIKTKNGVKTVESNNNSKLSTMKLQWAKNQNIKERVKMFSLNKHKIDA